ncbi:MAG: hypothetical protein ACOX3T_06350 [Bdellovibrionota bacterium]
MRDLSLNINQGVASQASDVERLKQIQDKIVAMTKSSSEIIKTQEIS